MSTLFKPRALLPDEPCFSRMSSLTPVWNVRIASCASANRAFSRSLEAANAELARVTLALAAARSRLALLRSLLALVWTASTAPVPASATSTAAAADVTPTRCRVSQRKSTRVHGSRQAPTGSSAIHRSTSSAIALGEA